MNTQRNGNGGVKEPTLVLEVIDDPAIAESIRAQIERGRRNLKWLSSHWDEVLPQARGLGLGALDREHHARVARDVLELPLIWRQMSRNDLVAVHPYPDAGHLR